MKKILFASLAGSLFAAGLVVSGMTQPAKVLGFLDIGALTKGVSWTAQPGYWDPSLALVMAGALAVTLFAFASGAKRAQPWFAERFTLPTRRDIDWRLLVGSALFGMGWALVGYCPGPALASLLVGGVDTVLFVAAMGVGMVAAKKSLHKGRAQQMKQQLIHWLESIAGQSGGEILAVQTLRNAMMAASVLASAALVGLMGVFATAHLHQRGFTVIAASLLVMSVACAVHALLRLSVAGFEFQLKNQDVTPVARGINLGLRSCIASGVLLVLALAVAALGVWR